MRANAVADFDADVNCYYGSVFHSVERLPKWYQILAICSIFVVLWLEHTPVVEFFLQHAEFRFGLNFLWDEGYLVSVQQLHLADRAMFAVVTVALSAVVFLLTRLGSNTALANAEHLRCFLPGVKYDYALLTLSGCPAAIVVLRDFLLASHSGRSADLWQNTIASFVNRHLVIHAVAMSEMMWWWMTRVGLSILLALIHRILRDASRQRNASIRWYLVTFTIWRLVIHFIDHFFGFFTLSAASSFLIVASCVTIVTAVNFKYGYSLRKCESYSSSKLQCTWLAFSLMLRCGILVLLPFMLTIVVSIGVQVVELFVLWAAATLLALWLPCTIDACCTDFMASLSTAVLLVMNALGGDAESAIRGSILCFGGLLATSLVYNAVVNAFDYRRFVGVGLLGPPVAAALWFLRIAMREMGNLSHNCTNGNIQKWALFWVAILLCLFAAAGSLWENEKLSSGKEFSEDQSLQQQQQQQRKLPLVTIDLLRRKLVHTAILGLFVAVSLALALWLNSFVSTYVTFAPTNVASVVAVVAGFSMFGSLLEVRQIVYHTFLRALGLFEHAEETAQDI